MNSDPPCKWQLFMNDARQRVSTGCTLEVRGTLTRLTGLVLEATLDRGDTHFKRN